MAHSADETRWRRDQVVVRIEFVAKVGELGGRVLGFSVSVCGGR